MLNAYASVADCLTEMDLFTASVTTPPKPVWIDLFNATKEEDALVEKLLDILIPSRSEMEEIELSSRLYQEDGAVFMTMPILANLETDEPIKTPVTFIMKGDTLVTVRYADPRPFQAYRTRASRQKDAFSRDGEQVMVGILEALTDRTADALEKIGDDIDQLSREVFTNKAKNIGKKTQNLQAIIRQIGSKTELLTMIQESLVGLGRITSYHAALDTKDRRTETSREMRRMLKVVQGDATSLGEHARSLIERASFLLDATLGLISLEQNQIIKIFSVAAVVFLPPTLVASTYGMNFDVMPELGWALGYPFALVLMAVSAVLPYLFFKRRGWL